MGKRSRVIHEPMPTVRAWRERLGLSRQRVAGMIDERRPDEGPTDQATIAKWESGETALRVSDLKLLAEIYGTTADRLLYDPGDHMTPALMAKAHNILVTKDPVALASWLASGEFLPEAPSAEK
jgi:transcriptional regulator with XRE-family HTH domain